ncbi:MAG: GNAT family N-acetyltransferase [Burkholderiales bacterium]|nr:MAG: GNAT family N-acetyltransferase [Burkholderiales bacterium]
MKDIPVPTLALSPTQLMPSQLPRGSLHPSLPTPLAKADEERQTQSSALKVSWAKHLDEVREAQRLRYAVFADEMGARLSNTLPGHDVDRFDDFCEHLLVRDEATDQVVGTYRLLTPVQAKRAGGLYTQTEFNIDALSSLTSKMVELGRSCVHADYRHGAVIMALWGALAQFMQRNQLSSMVGCASIPMLHQGRVSGDAAVSIWHQVSQTHLADQKWHVFAHTPLPVTQFDLALNVEPPALIKGYLRLGARVLGAPAWDPDFNTADLPMLLRIEDMPSRYRKHFLGA